jgi:hypothetical protein
MSTINPFQCLSRGHKPLHSCLKTLFHELKKSILRSVVSVVSPLFPFYPKTAAILRVPQFCLLSPVQTIAKPALKTPEAIYLIIEAHVCEFWVIEINVPSFSCEISTMAMFRPTFVSSYSIFFNPNEPYLYKLQAKLLPICA